MINSTRPPRHDYAVDDFDTETIEDDMKPYLSLFLKPSTTKKSVFSKKELAVMCKDPLHSPQLIRYLIDFVREM